MPTAKACLAVILLTFPLAPALAQETCMVPTPPEPVDGATATLDQARAAVQDAKDFIADSDAYQDCLEHQIHDAAERARLAGVAPDPGYAADAQARIDANQKLKQQVGNQANAVFPAYRKAHPSP